MAVEGLYKGKPVRGSTGTAPKSAPKPAPKATKNKATSGARKQPNDRVTVKPVGGTKTAPRSKPAPAQPAPKPKTTTAADRRARRNAADALRELFRSYGLGSLAPKILELVREFGPENTSTIIVELQKTKEYKERFSANDARLKAGLRVLSPAEYLAQEDSYREAMRRAGLPEWMYDETRDFNRFLEVDVSPTELFDRSQQAVNLALTVDETQKRALIAYGIDSSDLAGYFLDPAKGLPQLQSRFDRATIAAERERAGFGKAGSDTEWVDQMYSAGVTSEEARIGYGRIAEQLDTDETLGEIYGESYSLRDAEKAEFLQDASAKQKQKQLRSRERAAFRGSSGTGRNTLARDDRFS